MKHDLCWCPSCLFMGKYILVLAVSVDWKQMEGRGVGGVRREDF